MVAGTCPDFGVITAIPQPLRSAAERLVAAAGRAAGAGGHRGRAARRCALARLVSPQFVGQPDLFAPDQFHPSGAGYGRAMAVLVPAAIPELDKAVAAAAAPTIPGSAVDHPLSA